MNKNKLTYMDCWHYIAPLIPITSDPLSTQIYVMVFNALSTADKQEAVANYDVDGVIEKLRLAAHIPTTDEEDCWLLLDDALEIVKEGAE